MFEPRFETAERVGIGLDLLELSEHFADNDAVRKPRELTAVLLLGNIVDLFFGVGDRFARLRPLRAHFDNALCGADERAADRVAADNFKILLVICRGGRDFGKLGDAHQPARAFQRSVLLQHIGERDDIDGFARGVHLLHRVQNEAVGFLIEIVLAERFQKLGLNIHVNEDTAQDRGLRL